MSMHNCLSVGKEFSQDKDELNDSQQRQRTYLAFPCPNLDNICSRKKKAPNPKQPSIRFSKQIPPMWISRRLKKKNKSTPSDTIIVTKEEEEEKKTFFFPLPHITRWCFFFYSVDSLFTRRAFVIQLIFFLKMTQRTEIDQFLPEERPKTSSKCFSKWWHQKYPHQQVICRIIESFPFRATVILLVIIDTALVIGEIMLDSVKIHYECDADNHQSHAKREIFKKRIELIMEIVHFTSIGILAAFVLELLVRIYASGKEFYNIRRKKMEYFDAFIVIVSLGIDLYLLRVEKQILREELLFMFSFRLWRFVRIVSSTFFFLLLYLSYSII